MLITHKAQSCIFAREPCNYSYACLGLSAFLGCPYCSFANACAVRYIGGRTPLHAGPQLYPCCRNRLACSGLVSHLIVHSRAIRCGTSPIIRLAH